MLRYRIGVRHRHGDVGSGARRNALSRREPIIADHSIGFMDDKNGRIARRGARSGGSGIPAFIRARRAFYQPKAGRQIGRPAPSIIGLDSSVVVPPSVMMASAPSVVMTVAMTMTMTVAALDLDDRSAGIS